MAEVLEVDVNSSDDDEGLSEMSNVSKRQADKGALQLFVENQNQTNAKSKYAYIFMLAHADIPDFAVEDEPYRTWKNMPGYKMVFAPSKMLIAIEIKRRDSALKLNFKAKSREELRVILSTLTDKLRPKDLAYIYEEEASMKKILQVG